MAVKKYYFKNINFHKFCIADSRHLGFEDLNLSESKKNNTGNGFPMAKLYEKDTFHVHIAVHCHFQLSPDFGVAHFENRPLAALSPNI